MTPPSAETLDSLWARHHAEWREPAQIASHWEDAAATDPALLQFKTKGDWWDLLEQKKITLLITREYEHLVMALTAAKGKPLVSFLRMPHPSGLVVDREKNVVHIASTRNPNQIFELSPATGVMPRLDVKAEALPQRPLVPIRSRFFPGSLYMHDLALIGGQLHANAVGQNAVVRLGSKGCERVWWPRCIETKKGPIFGQNHLQLNSIAAGDDIAGSFFSASTDVVSSRRPGHRNFPVDRRGVIFSGRTRDVVARGLTRPHSARLHEGRVWVDNSGYGQLGFIEDGALVSTTPLPGWTRGLCFHGRTAFVGTSRVIPRFRQYAPGLDVDKSACGLHAVDTRTGEIQASLTWPGGNQIFAIDWMPRKVSCGFPFLMHEGKGAAARIKKMFYAYEADPQVELEK